MTTNALALKRKLADLQSAGASILFAQTQVVLYIRGIIDQACTSVDMGLLYGG